MSWLLQKDIHGLQEEDDTQYNELYFLMHYYNVLKVSRSDQHEDVYGMKCNICPLKCMKQLLSPI